MACFAVEYAGLFLGVSLFMRAHNCLYILLHSIGAVLIGLLYTQVGADEQQARHSTWLQHAAPYRLPRSPKGCRPGDERHRRPLS